MKKWLVILVGILGVAGSVYAQSGGTATAQLTWQDTQNTEHEGYVMERRSKPSGGQFSPYAVIANNIAKDSRTYADAGLAPGAEYCWRLYAFNATERGPDSNEACIVIPATPGGTITLNVTITVTFTPPAVGVTIP